MDIGDRPFVGSEALASGLVKKHQLRAHFRAAFPDVYVPKNAVLTVHQRAKAAWLYSHREGVVAGLTASALHGAQWVDDDLPIELIWSNARRPRGLRTFDMRLRSNEFVELDDMRITTVERTAFDRARRVGLTMPLLALTHSATRRASRLTMCLQSPIAIAVPADSASYAPRSTCTTLAPRRRRKHGCDSW
jgi:hypothetical protein